MSLTTSSPPTLKSAPRKGAAPTSFEDRTTKGCTSPARGVARQLAQPARSRDVKHHVTLEWFEFPGDLGDGVVGHTQHDDLGITDGLEFVVLYEMNRVASVTQSGAK